MIPLAICIYRFAAKFNENQKDLWVDRVVDKNRTSTFSHQLIYNELVRKMIETKIVRRPQP